MTNNNPKLVIDQSNMTAFQCGVIAICICLNALDGFDVLSISFASPGIAAEWGINRAALGVVLAAELFGMAIGSIILGSVADSKGRRPVILGSLSVMTLGMYLAGFVGSIPELLTIRFITGLGIGGVLATTNAMVSEFSNEKNRSFTISLMAAGYPLGSVVGGWVSTILLQSFDWRAIFVFGGLVSTLVFIIVWFWLPESIGYLSTKQPKNALDKLNAILKKMGHASLDALPERKENDAAGQNSLASLFSKKYVKFTLLLSFGYFTMVMVFYFLVKWIPKIVVDMGYDPSTAGMILVWSSVGGLLGCLSIGLISKKIGLTPLITIYLCLAFISLAAFGYGQNSLQGLSIVAAIAGFFSTACIVGYYALTAKTFPAEVRAGGTGVVIGIGRGGAVLAPIVGGLLFEASLGLFGVSLIIGSSALVSIGCVVGLSAVTRKIT